MNKFFNGALLISRYEANSLIGNGYDFDTKNEQLKEWWENFKHFNDLDNLLYDIAANNSLNGRSIMALEKLGENIGVIQHYYLATAEISTDCVGKPRLVKLDIPVNFDVRNYKVERIYTENEVISKVFDEQDAKYLIGSGGKIKLSDDVVIQKSYKHNFGFVPIVVSTNLPFKTTQYMPQNVLIRLESSTDTTYSNTLFKMFFQNDTAWAKPIEDEINFVYQVLHDECIKAQTMLIVSGGSGQNLMADNSQTMDKYHLDAFKSNGFLLNLNGRDVKVDVKTNQNKLQEIYSLIDILIEDYFNKCGLSYPSISGGNNKHSAEIKTLMLQTTETHNMKRRSLEKSIKEIIYKAAQMYGFKKEDINFTFKLRELQLETELEKVQSLSTALQSGLIDKVGAIMDFNKITRERAEEKEKTISEELKEKNDELVKQAKAVSNNGQSNGVGAQKNV